MARLALRPHQTAPCVQLKMEICRRAANADSHHVFVVDMGHDRPYTHIMWCYDGRLLCSDVGFGALDLSLYLFTCGEIARIERGVNGVAVDELQAEAIYGMFSRKGEEKDDGENG